MDRLTRCTRSPRLGEYDGMKAVQAAARSGTAQIEGGAGRFVTCREPLLSENNNGNSCDLDGGEHLSELLDSWCSFRDDGVCLLVDPDGIIMRRTPEHCWTLVALRVFCAPHKKWNEMS